MERKKPPVVRSSLEHEYRSHFEHHILPELGEVELLRINLSHLERLRTALRAKKTGPEGRERTLSEKTIRNVIDGAFRAFFRDAARDLDPRGVRLPYPYPFSLMEWGEYVPPEPDPFTVEERDKLLEYYRGKRWKVGGFNDSRPHHPYYVYLYTLFFTGPRPSEIAALRIGSVDLKAGTLYVRRSLHRGQEGNTKTRRARHECTRQTTALLQRAAGAAVQTLTALMTDAEISSSVRATAARSILELSYRASELDVQEQLRQLEAKYKEIESLILQRKAVFPPEGLSMALAR